MNDHTTVAETIAAGLRIEEYRRKVATPKVWKDVWLQAVLAHATVPEDAGLTLLEFQPQMTHVHDVANDDGEWNTWDLKDRFGLEWGVLS